LVAAGGLFALWWLRKWGVIRGLDFRVFFALLEMRERRCGLPKGRDPEFGLAELARLCGGAAEAELRRSLRRLRRAGLVRRFTRSALVLAKHPAELTLDEATRELLDEKLLLLRSPRRLVPFPRRMARLLASGTCCTFAGVILGTAIATLFCRKGEVSSRGAYKASWLAEAFGISERTVYRHRTYLAEQLGWIRVIDSHQLRQNARGLLVEVDLDWEGAPSAASGDAKAGAGGAESPICQAPPAGIGARLSGPRDLDKEPLREELNTKPAPGGGHGSGVGVYQPKFQDGNPDTTGPRPSLKRVTAEDLKDPGRLAALREQAIGEGLITSSEHDRLQFFAAAERARSVGSKNPPGLFVRIVRSGLWRFLSQDDEDAARRKIRDLLYPEGRPKSIGPHGPISGLPGSIGREARIETGREGPSEDALVVRAVTNALRRAGFKGDPFYALKRQRPEWTRDRWDRAAAELGAGTMAR
jgi:hypothetical protein